MFGTLKVKKLVSVLATSTLMTGPRKKTLEYIFCIYYPVQFKKDTVEVQALIYSKSEFNAMVSTYAKKLGFRIQKTNVRAKRIDEST